MNVKHNKSNNKRTYLIIGLVLFGSLGIFLFGDQTGLWTIGGWEDDGGGGGGGGTIIIPDPPVIVSLNPTNFDGIVDLEWALVNNANDYHIWRSFNGGLFGFIGETSQTSYSDTGLSNGFYRYKILSHGTYFSTYSNTVFTNVQDENDPPPDPVAPDEPLLNTISIPLEDDISLNWNDVDDAIKYNVWQSTDGVNFDLIETVTYSIHHLFGLADGTYWYKITAENIHGLTSDYSNEEYITIDTYVESVYSIEDITPVLLKPTLITSTTNFILSWESVEDAKSYHIYRSYNGDTLTEISSVNGNTLTYIDMDLTEGKYLYRITAKDIDFKESKLSNPQILEITVESAESDLSNLILPIVFLVIGLFTVIILSVFLRRKRISRKRIK